MGAGGGGELRETETGKIGIASKDNGNTLKSRKRVVLICC